MSLIGTGPPMPFDNAPLTASQRDRTRQIRFVMGLILFLGMIYPAATEPQKVMRTMENAPPLWLPTSVPARAHWDLFREVFLDTDIMIFSWPGCELGTEAMDRVAEAVVAIDNEENQSGDPWFTRVATGNDAIARLTQAPVALSEAQSIARLKGTIVGPDGKTTCVFVPFTRAGERQRWHLVDKIREIAAREANVPPEDVHFAGPPTDGWHTDRATVDSMELLTFPSWLLASLLAWLCVRSLVLTLPILLLSLVAQGIVLAMVGYSGAPMNAVLIVLPPLVFVLTVSAGIHLSNYYLDIVNDDETISPGDAADLAIAIGTRPCWLAAGTTVIGLMSLTVVHIWPVAYFGAIASIGVILMLAILLLIMPYVMTVDARLRSSNHWLASRAPRSNKSSLPAQWLTSVLRFAVALPTLTFLTFVAGSVVTGMGIPKLETSVNLPRMFSKSSEMRRDAAWIEEHLGPTVGAELMIRIPPEALASRNDAGEYEPNSLKRLAFVATLHNELRKNSADHGIISAMTFLPRPNMSRSMQGAANRAGIKQQITDPASKLHELGYVNEREDEQYWRITLRMPAREDVSCQQEMVQIKRVLEPVVAEKGEGSIAIYTGAVPISGEAQILLLHDLFRSFITTFVIVAIVMAIVLRSIIGGILSMFPNLFPTLTLFGLMGWSGMPLDIGTVMTASVALGIAVDGTLHMLERFRHYDLEGAAPCESAWRSLVQCGPAMWQTTVICGLSMLIYAYTDFVPTQQFAFMMFGLLTAALIGDALILPAMMASPVGKWFRIQSRSGNRQTPLSSDDSANPKSLK